MRHNPIDIDAVTLERVVPDALELGEPVDQETLQIHLERYEFAVQHVRPGRVLDMACGVGYGTRLLADAHPDSVEAVGVDISAHAISYARRRYGNSRIDFRVEDAMTFTDPAGFDSIVTLETIEHLEHPAEYVARLKNLLRCDGMLIASVPTTPSTDFNPHHRQDFTESSFRKLLTSLGFEEVDLLRQVQPVHLGPLLRHRSGRFGGIRKKLVKFYFCHPTALVRRLVATVRYGLTNRYITVAGKYVQ